MRERKEDIPALVAHFVNRYARRSGKDIENVAPRPIKEMMLYDWPGNVRELEHVIERSVLMTTGPIIKEIYLPKMDKRSLFSPGEQPIKSRKQNEKDHILAALKKSMGKVGGPGGAAEILHMPSTTLHSRIKTLGIKKEYE